MKDRCDEVSLIDLDAFSQDVLTLIERVDANSDPWRAADREARVSAAVRLAYAQAAPTQPTREAWDNEVSARPEVGSLSCADVLRIRIGKLIARELPSETYQDIAQRALLRSAVRDLVAEHLGPLEPSAYLDGQRKRQQQR